MKQKELMTKPNKEKIFNMEQKALNKQIEKNKFKQYIV
jgi:hypothetical protein